MLSSQIQKIKNIEIMVKEINADNISSDRRRNHYIEVRAES